MSIPGKKNPARGETLLYGKRGTKAEKPLESIHFHLSEIIKHPMLAKDLFMESRGDPLLIKGDS